MSTVKQVKRDMLAEGEWWLIPFMDFVDEFREDKDLSILQKPFEIGHERFDALLASTIEYLCDEMGLQPPRWVEDVPGCEGPWFVSELENLKAIAIVESPLRFRMRKIFVLENFLNRV